MQNVSHTKVQLDVYVYVIVCMCVRVSRHSCLIPTHVWIFLTQLFGLRTVLLFEYSRENFAFFYIFFSSCVCHGNNQGKSLLPL